MRPFLFLSGEYQTTMPLVFERDPWQHTMSSRRLVEVRRGVVRRDNVPREEIRGVLWYASVEDERVLGDNLATLARARVPCWPAIGTMCGMMNRHELMAACVWMGFVDHWVQCYARPGLPIFLPRPFVLKTGNLHRGEGKHLIREGDALPEWEGWATAEPFFEGQSCRVLIIGDQHFGIRYDNPSSWIKNAAGADVEMWPEIPRAAVEHALRVHRYFGLEMSGIDYIIGAGGAVHFLEYNQFPGISVSDEVQAAARRVLSKAMDQIEAAALDRS